MLDRLSKNKRNLALAVLAALLGWFFWTIRGVLNPLILGYLLAFVLHPAVLHLERQRNWSRRRAVNVIFVLAALFLAGTIGGIYLQGRQLVERVALANEQQDVIRQAEERVDAFLAKARSWTEGWLEEDEPAPESDGEPGGEEESANSAVPAAADGSGGAPGDETESGVEPEAGTDEEPQTLSEGLDELAGLDGGDELTLRDLVRAWWQGYVERTGGGAGTLAMENAPAIVVLLVNFFGSVASLVTLLLLLPIYGYFLLFELERIHRFIRRHVPKSERYRVTRIGTQIGEVIANFFRGRLLICVLKGGVVTAGLLAFGAPYALFFGVAAGLFALVPFVGPTLVFLLAFLFGLSEMALVHAALTIGGTFLVAELLEGYVFIPKILGDSLGLHPVVVLVSVFAGGAALGMFGFLIAIPLTAALVILGREIVMPALRQFADEDRHVGNDEGESAAERDGLDAG